MLGLDRSGPIRFPRAVIEDAPLIRMLQTVHRGAGERAAERLTGVLDRLLVFHAAPRKGVPPARAHAAAVDAAAAIIREQYRRKLRLADLAESLGLGPYQLARAFRHRHGLSPASYQMVHRINQSQAMLAAGAPVIDAALESGFYDQSHFVRHLKRFAGTSPSDYRRRCEWR